MNDIPNIAEVNDTDLKFDFPKKNDIRIILDAGHGGKDSGAVGIDNRLEKKINLTAVRIIDENLKSNNIETYLTRRKDMYIPLNKRCQLANSWGTRKDFFVSIHCNAFSNPEANGSEVLVYNKGNDIAKVGEDILKDYTKIYSMKNRGVKVRKNLRVLNGTYMQAMLIELGFITNPYDAEQLQMDLAGFANVIVNRITEYIRGEGRWA